jgi:hypothetical protein
MKNFFSKLSISVLKDEIKVAKNIDKYFDENGTIRRIERLYNKGVKLNEVNNKIINQLNNIFGEPYVIFKDKFNAKPPGGRGFLLTTTESLCLKMRMEQTERDGMNIQIIL